MRASSGGVRPSTMPPTISSEAEQQRDEIAEARESVGELAAGGSTASITPGGAPRQRLDDVAAGVDHRADPGRRRAEHRQAFLGRAQPRLGEMLRRAPARRTRRRSTGLKMKSGRLRSVDDLAREDDLVAELEADLAPLAAEVDRARARARR